MRIFFLFRGRIFQFKNKFYDTFAALNNMEKIVVDFGKKYRKRTTQTVPPFKILSNT